MTTADGVVFSQYRRLAFAVPPICAADSDQPLWNQKAIMIVGVLLLLLIIGLTLIPIAKCALRFMGSESPRQIQVRLANTGIQPKVVEALPTVVYSEAIEAGTATSSGSDCPICLAQFADGEKLRLLPRCHHGFHVKCIDTWLRSHSSCPICRHILLT